MKSAIMTSILALFVSTQAFAFNYNNTKASPSQVECKNQQGNIVPETQDALNLVMHSHSNRPQVFVKGQIVQILPEDKAGLPHQKYIISAFNGTKLQVVSNLDFGRIPVQVGSVVEVCGEYINAEGGMVHWTHFDPHGGHPNGYTILNGQLYGDQETSF